MMMRKQSFLSISPLASQANRRELNICVCHNLTVEQLAQTSGRIKYQLIRKLSHQEQQWTSNEVDISEKIAMNKFKGPVIPRGTLRKTKSKEISLDP